MSGYVQESTSANEPITTLFPEASEAALQSVTKRDLQRKRVEQWRRDHRLLRSTLWIVFVGGIAAGAVTAAPVLFLLPLAAAITWLYLYARQSSDAADDLFDAYTSSRGLTWRANWRDPSMSDLPILEKGDKRKFHRVATGQMLDTIGSISHYTYTEISTDSEGNRTESDYHFTLAHFPLPSAVAARYPGVYVRRKGLVSGKMFDRLTHDRQVELESAEFRKRYSLRVADEQDDVALYELMSTSFIQHMIDAGTIDGQVVQFEQRASSLLVYVKSHLGSSTDIDNLIRATLPIYRRFCDEYQ